MGEDEKALLKGKAVEDYKSSVEELALLRCKSNGYVKAIADAVELLGGKPPATIRTAPCSSQSSRTAH